MYNFTQGDCKKYSRNTWANIKLIIFIILFAGGISTFDLAYKCFPEFELPFIVISLIVLLFPLLLFVGYIIISRIVVKALKRKCKRRIQKVKKCLYATARALSPGMAGNPKAVRSTLVAKPRLADFKSPISTAIQADDRQTVCSPLRSVGLAIG